MYQIVCLPECGKPIVEAYNDCGFSSSVQDFLVGMCGTNSNGRSCYEAFFDSISLLTKEVFCSHTFTQTGTCSCKLDLTSAVDEIGCCINVFHDYFSSTSPTLNYRDLYAGCNVALPDDCNNSPISGQASSSSVPLGFKFPILAAQLLLASMPCFGNCFMT